MNKAPLIHQYYLDRIADVLPEYKRLSNPYKVEENAAILLKNGYGVTIGPAETGKLTHTPVLSITRTFAIKLTRLYRAREEDGAAKAESEKALADDARKLQVDLESKIDMEGLVLKSRWVSDGGIEYVGVNTDRFIKIEMVFEVRYFEANS